MISIARRCHSEFILRSFFTFFPDTRSYSSEEDLKNERLQRHKDNAGRTVSARMRTDRLTSRNGKEHLSFNAIARMKCNVYDVCDAIASIKFICKLLFIRIFYPSFIYLGNYCLFSYATLSRRPFPFHSCSQMTNILINTSSRKNETALVLILKQRV